MFYRSNLLDEDRGSSNRLGGLGNVAMRSARLERANSCERKLLRLVCIPISPRPHDVGDLLWIDGSLSRCGYGLRNILERSKDFRIERPACPSLNDVRKLNHHRVSIWTWLPEMDSNHLQRGNNPRSYRVNDPGIYHPSSSSEHSETPYIVEARRVELRSNCLQSRCLADRHSPHAAPISDALMTICTSNFAFVDF